MLKTIKLKLTNVQYSGDSIGDDIRIELEVLGKFLRIDKKIKVGTSVTVGQDIGSFETDQKIFKTTAHSTVNIHHESFIQAHYSVSKKLFFLNGKKYQTTDYQKAKWEKGFYDIEIPDYAHPGGARYPEAKRAKTWFKIGHSGDRYLHTGGISLGCITIIEKKRWMEIYSALIKARKGDFTSVGILEVID